VQWEQIGTDRRTASLRTAKRRKQEDASDNRSRKKRNQGSEIPAQRSRDRPGKMSPSEEPARKENRKKKDPLRRKDPKNKRKDVYNLNNA